MASGSTHWPSSAVGGSTPTPSSTSLSGEPSFSRRAAFSYFRHAKPVKSSERPSLLRRSCDFAFDLSSSAIPPVFSAPVAGRSEPGRYNSSPSDSGVGPQQVHGIGGGEASIDCTAMCQQSGSWRSTVQMLARVGWGGGTKDFSGSGAPLSTLADRPLAVSTTQSPLFSRARQSTATAAVPPLQRLARTTRWGAMGVKSGSHRLQCTPVRRLRLRGRQRELCPAQERDELLIRCEWPEHLRLDRGRSISGWTGAAGPGPTCRAGRSGL